LNSQVEANSVINLLHSKGIAKVVGKKRRPDGRGRSATIYEIPQNATISLFDDEDMPKTVEVSTDEVEEKTHEETHEEATLTE